MSPFRFERSLSVVATAGALILALLWACQESPSNIQAPQASPVIETDPVATPGAGVLMRVPTDPTVSFSIAFGVGSQNDPQGMEGLAYLTGQMIAEAATEQDSLESILEKLYPIASSYRIRVDREMSTLTGRTHRDNLDAFVELFINAYQSPAFLDNDFQRIKSDTINYLSNSPNPVPPKVTRQSGP